MHVVNLVIRESNYPCRSRVFIHLALAALLEAFERSFLVMFSALRLPPIFPPFFPIARMTADIASDVGSVAGASLVETSAIYFAL